MYQNKLSDDEIETLGWLTDRGYFPKETYDAMSVIEAEDRDYFSDLTYERKHREWIWDIAEHAAWAILTHREDDSESLYACCCGNLLDKLEELEKKIV